MLYYFNISKQFCQDIKKFIFVFVFTKPLALCYNVAYGFANYIFSEVFMNTQAKKSPFCLGALFLLIAASLSLLLSFVNMIPMIKYFKFIKIEGVLLLYVVPMIGVIMEIVFSIFLLMRKRGLVSGILSLALSLLCFTDILSAFSPMLNLFGYGGISAVGTGITFIFAIFSVLFRSTLWTVIGLYMILPKHPLVKKIFSIVALICAITVLSFSELGALVSLLATGRLIFASVFDFLIIVPLSGVGLLLITKWVFADEKIDATEPIALEAEELSAVAEPAVVAEPVVVAEPAVVAEPVAVAVSAPEVVAPTAPAAPAAPKAVAQPAPVAKPAPAVANNAAAIAEQLRTYKQLLDEGVINEEEYETMKKQILGI